MLTSLHKSFIIKAIFFKEVYSMAARKTIDERIALIDEKIAKRKAEIESLESQKNKLLHPVNMKTVMAKAKEAGLTPEEVAEKLGLDI